MIGHVNKKLVCKKFTCTCQEFQSLSRLDCAKHSGNCAKHSSLLAVWHRTRLGRRVEQTTVTCRTRNVSKRLTLETQYRTMAVSLAVLYAHIVYQEFSIEIVRAINHKIVVLDDVGSIVGGEKLVVSNHIYVRVHRQDTLARRLNLALANVIGRMDYLPLKIAQINHITVNNAKRAHASRRQIHKHRRAQSARAYNEHLAIANLLLTFCTDAFQYDVARISLLLLVGKLKHNLSFVNILYHKSGNRHSKDAGDMAQRAVYLRLFGKFRCFLLADATVCSASGGFA